MSFSELLTQLESVVALFDVVIKGADFKLVTPLFVALYALVLIRVIKTFNHSVAFLTLKTFGTLIPPQVLLQVFAVFSDVLKVQRRPSKVSHVVSVDTSFRIVSIFLGWTPARLISIHKEGVAVIIFEHRVQVQLEERTTYQAVRYKVVLYAVVLEVLIHSLNASQI